LNLRYHHVLETHHLGGKCNWHVDYVIQVLTTCFQSEFKNQYGRQDIGLNGPDLKGSCHRQILTSTQTTSPDLIHQISNTKFVIASQSHPGYHYMIDLNQSTYNCNDFSRIWFCKHIAAITVHSSKGGSLSEALECMCTQGPPVRTRDLPQCVPKLDEESRDILL
jgi:hypothetical protein